MVGGGGGVSGLSWLDYCLFYSSTPMSGHLRFGAKVALHGREQKFMTSSQKHTYIHTAHNIAAKVQHSNTTFNYTDVDIHIK